MCSNKSHRPALKLAVLGTRGIPACYGGFETFAEELSYRLVLRGHEVTVYGRTGWVDRATTEYRGVRIRVLPCVKHKYMETVSHTILSVMDSLRRDYDLLLVCNAANAFLCRFPALVDQKVLLNVDGIERLRRKWNRIGRAFYRFGEFLATQLPDSVVTDAAVVRDYYLREYGFETTFIAYGAPAEREAGCEALSELGLEAGRYLLYVSRLEPENNAGLVARAFLDAGLEYPLVLVGDAPYSRAYIEELKTLAGRGKILMPGAIYGKAYRELLSHSLCYIQATEVGGTHPALIEAMGAGSIVIANDTPEHREVMADTGLFYPFNDAEGLSVLMREVGSRPAAYDGLRDRAQLRIRNHYGWESIVNRYEELFYEILDSPSR